MRSRKVALDTNVLVYLYDSSNPGKRSIALDLLSEKPQIPAQVISEYLNTLRRLLPMTKEDILMHAANLFEECHIIPTLPVTLYSASSLIKNINFNFLTAYYKPCYPSYNQGLNEILLSKYKTRERRPPEVFKLHFEAVSFL